MSNELVPKTVIFEPAKVEFNFDELSTVLDEKLKQYEGLEFTEEQATECNKTITELNKGKKALNDYRLATKKELSVSITEFEDSCKKLASKFDDVIKPLKEQADEFEDDRRAEKREKVQLIIDELIEKEGLNDKFSSQLIIENSYLNKSKTMKSIREELTTKASHLGIAQDKEESDIEIIKMSVGIANDKYGASLLEQTYVRILEHEDIEKIKQLIIEDAQEEVKKDVPPVEKVKPNKIAPKKKKEDRFVEKYEVTGTDDQLNDLEDYMTKLGLKWSVIENV